MAELGNGVYIASNVDGVHLIDPVSGQTSLVMPGIRTGCFAPITVGLAAAGSADGAAAADPASVTRVPWE